MRGDVMGGGFELVLSADLIVASETAAFTCIEVTSGMVPLAGAVQRIAADAEVGRALATELREAIGDTATVSF